MRRYSWETGPFQSQYLAAFKHRNFRLFFVGQLLSISGTWMQKVAEGWLAYRITGSALMLGLVAFAWGAPAIFLSPIAGLIADRMDRRRMLMFGQAAAMVQAFTLALLTLKGWITPTRLALLALVMGVVNSFENPARHSFFAQLVSREDLINAIGLNATLVYTARVVGPAVAGLIIAAYSEGVCFFINGLSYMAVLLCVQVMQFEKRGRERRSLSTLELLREGSGYVKKNHLVRSLLMLFAVMNFAGVPYLTLMPMMAGVVLGMGATGLGCLFAASASGSLICGIFMAGRPEPLGLLKAVLVASLLFGTALFGLSLSREFFLALAVLPFIGGGYLVT
ncbi:MAG: MFS transporter, partial [Acidobacteria bacterium]